MDADGKASLKRTNPGSVAEYVPTKLTKTDTGSAYPGSSNTGYSAGQSTSSTTPVHKPKKNSGKVETDSSNPVIANVQNILMGAMVTGMNPYAAKDAISKLKGILGPTPSNYYEQKIPKGKQLCRHYAKGYCQRGTACSFLHSDLGPNVNEQVFSGLQELGVGQTYYPGGYNGNYMQQQQGQQAYQGQGQHQGYQGASSSWYPQQGYMWGQQNTGNQWRNNSNATTTSAPNTAYTANTTQSGEQQKEIGPQEYPGVPKEKKVCRHFAAGFCRRGDSCAFSHPESNSPNV